MNKISNRGFTLIRKSCQGFTLIELLVVIGVLGILAGLLIANVSGVRARARDSQRKNDMRQIKEALRMYYNNNGNIYPDGDGGAIVGCGTTALPTTCAWGTDFIKNSITYMKALPKDPLSGTAGYDYVYTKVDRDNFRIYTTLENKSDQDITKSQTRCGVATPPAGAYYVCAD